ncbi:hypothetical protein DOY81_001838 [Sarcophaga bullata]|nr:hypothetical protein DOY81_001838 [Sarcophaga bullata]
MLITIFTAIAIDLIVQHIRDFLNNRSCHGSTSNIQMVMNLDTLNAGDATSSYQAIRRFSALCKELTIKSNVFFEKNINLTQH